MPDIHFLNEPGPDVIVCRDTFPPDADHPEPYTFVRVNVPRTVVWHSPAGFEFGFGGSGPADLALNILQAFLPGRDVECLHGTKCSRAAARLHQDFKEQFLAHVPEGTYRIEFPAAEIKAWIEVSLPQEFRPGPCAAHELAMEDEDAKAEPLPAVQPAPATNTADDLRTLTRLTGDFLRLVGHQVGAEGKILSPDPFKAAAVLRDLDVLLGRLESDLGLTPKPMAAR